MFGWYLVGVWMVFWEENRPKPNTKTVKNFLLIFYKGPQNEFYLGILITSYWTLLRGYLGIVWGVFGRCLEGILGGKPIKNQHQSSQKLSTNFLQGTPKRVLPRDSHYFLLGPINPFKGANFDLSLTLFDTRNLQKQTENASKSFLLLFK